MASQQIRGCPVDMTAFYATVELPGYVMVDTSSSSSPAAAPEPGTVPPPPSAPATPFPPSPPMYEYQGDCKLYGTGAMVGIAMAVCGCWALLNLGRVDQQGWLNNFAVSWQIATTIAIVATILSGDHGHASSHNVWEIWRNRSGWPDRDFGYVVLTGLTASLFSFSGYEAGAHMAEETRNASTSSSWGLVATTVVTSIVGLMYILGLLYSIPPKVGIFTALTMYGGAGGAANAASLYAVATGNRTGLMLTNVLIANLFFAGSACAAHPLAACAWRTLSRVRLCIITVSSLTVTTRIAFAMARDGAFPFGKQLAHVWPMTKSPVGAVILVFVTDCLLLLLPLTTMSVEKDYGPIAFYAVTAICVIGCALHLCTSLLRCADARPAQIK